MGDKLVLFVLPHALVVSGVCHIVKTKDSIEPDNTVTKAPCVGTE